MIWPFNKIKQLFEDVYVFKNETLNNCMSVDLIQKDIEELNRCNFNNAIALVALADKLGLEYNWDKKEWVKVKKSRPKSLR